VLPPFAEDAAEHTAEHTAESRLVASVWAPARRLADPDWKVIPLQLVPALLAVPNLGDEKPAGQRPGGLTRGRDARAGFGRRQQLQRGAGAGGHGRTLIRSTSAPA
jgi:hypothetical protein